jgi:putative aldouronate transport system permease protein
MLELTRLKQRLDDNQAKPGQISKRSEFRASLEYARQNWSLFLLALPGIVLIFMFSYAPMVGVVIAFEDYSPRTVFASPFVGLRNFTTLFGSSIAGRLIGNTLLLNFMFIIATTLFSVVVAILLNEMRSTVFKRFSQSVMFLPFFMGWTIVAMVLFGLIDYNVGTINALLVPLGFERVILTDKPEIWPLILTLIRVWKGTGAGCIIYLAVLVSVDPQLHEAAAMDGAGRWGRIRYISLPALLPVIILLVLLDIGRIFYGDFGMIYAVIGNQANLYSTTDVIDTYILRALQTNSNYGFSAAVGFSQSVLGFICVFGANWMVKKYSERRGEDYRLF